MITLFILYFFINCILCCFINNTQTEIIYNSVYNPTKTIIPISTCTTNYITSIDNNGLCADGKMNQGSRCKSTTSIIGTINCITTSTETMYSTFILEPTTVQRIYKYKLNCKNKTSSTLIDII